MTEADTPSAPEPGPGGPRPAQMRPGPVAGVRVLDLTRLLPGGYCTLLLADLGADVIKVEEPGRGDYLRWTLPLVDGVSAAHRALNRGKRSITLNLKDPDGAAILGRLADRADVLVEGFRPGVMDRLGLGYERLSQGHPGLIYCAITGYGQDGPYRDRAGHDINYIGYAGLLALRAPGTEPQLPGVQVGDLGGGMLAAVGILAALVDRSVSGQGRFVDASLLDSAVSWLSIHAGAHLATSGHPGPEAAALTGTLACYRIYRTKDPRHITVGALEPPFWQAFCKVLGCLDLVDDQFAGPSRQHEMARRVQTILLSRPRAEWLEAFEDVDACVGPVNDLGEAFHDPQVLHRRMVAEIDSVPVGPGPALKLVGMDPSPLSPAPGLGEHTGEVLGAIGIPVPEQARLRDRGVL